MKLEEKTLLIKNKKAIIRSINENDAEQTIALSLDIANTSDFMMKYPEEVNLDIEQEKEGINNALDTQGLAYIGLFIDDVLAGWGGLFPVGRRIRLLHRGAIGVGILSSFRGMGIGKAILKELIELAKIHGYEQLELDVVTENKVGIALYSSFGFKKTGVIPHSFKMKDGKYYDFDIMVLNLLEG